MSKLRIVCLLLPILAAVGLAHASVIDVVKRGADNRCRRDAVAAIQTAITSAEPGDTIFFPAGCYTLNSSIYLRSHIDYRGAVSGRSELTSGVGGGYPFFEAPPDFARSTIDHLIFDGSAGIAMDKGDPSSNIAITNCTFKNNHNAHAAVSVSFGVGMTHSRVQHCLFKNNYNSDAGLQYEDPPPAPAFLGMGGVYLDHFQLLDNTFDTLDDDGIHAFWDGQSAAADVLIARNTCVGMHRICIELQQAQNPATKKWNSRLSGLIVEGNRNTPPYFGKPWSLIYGLSIVVDNAVGTVVRNNYIDGLTGIPTPRFLGYAIEVSGVNPVVEGNVVRWQVGPWLGIGFTNTSITVANNYVCGGAEPPKLEIEHAGATHGLVQSGNVVGVSSGPCDMRLAQLNAGTSSPSNSSPTVIDR